MMTSTSKAGCLLTVVAVCALGGCDTSARLASGPVFDDFLGPAGAAPDAAMWTRDIGSSAEKGWEQGSLQTYTDSSDNLRLDGRGHLVIEARASGDGYSSGRLVTRGRVDFPYGTVSARIKFPAGHGIWPAFWMLGSNIGAVGWPRCGEIDIMELVNVGSNYHVALHGPGADADRSGDIADLTDDFHTYWMTRAENSVTVGVDATTLESFTPSSLPPHAEWVFDGPMHVLLNIAVGGDWPGPPDSSTKFPATMLVDWFRFEPLI
jgi:beta-glucanase (GH16 family)